MHHYKQWFCHSFISCLLKDMPLSELCSNILHDKCVRQDERHEATEKSHITNGLLLISNPRLFSKQSTYTIQPISTPYHTVIHTYILFKPLAHWHHCNNIFVLVLIYFTS